MIVNLNEVLLPARKGKYAVGLFNTVNFEMARGVIAAAEALRAPVILGTAEVLLPYAPLEELSYFLIPMAKKVSVPVVVHYDHGLTFDKCMEALKLGFSSVMYDCSEDSYEENTRKVKELTRIAHAFGASVEGELGHVGNEDDSPEETQEASHYYTDPAQARQYVEETGVDALAIAVGTVHGTYRFEPKLDFDRIKEIDYLTDRPLVLHGGSGLSDEAFQTAIACGISKVNIFTDINKALAEGARMPLQNKKAMGMELLLPQIEAVKQATMGKMKLFGCAGKA